MEENDWRPDACAVCGAENVKRISYGMTAGPAPDDVALGGCVILEEVGPFAAPLVQWACGECDQRWAATPGSQVIPWRIKLPDVASLVRLLRRWLETSAELTIGADLPGSLQGPNAHVFVDIDGTPCYLEGGTTRDAVVDFLTTFDEEPCLSAVAAWPGNRTLRDRVVVGDRARAIPGLEFFVLEERGRVLTPSKVHSLHGRATGPTPGRPHWWAADWPRTYGLLASILVNIHGLTTRMYDPHRVCVDDSMGEFDGALSAWPDQIGFFLSGADRDLVSAGEYVGPHDGAIFVPEEDDATFHLHVFPDMLPPDGDATVIALIDRATREDRGEPLGSLEGDIARVQRALEIRDNDLHGTAHLIDGELRAVLGSSVVIRRDAECMTVQTGRGDACVARVAGSTLHIDLAGSDLDVPFARPYLRCHHDADEGWVQYDIDLDRVGLWQREVVSIIASRVREQTKERAVPLEDFDFGADATGDFQY